MTTMTLTIEDELAARIRERAQTKGVAPEDLARETLQEQFGDDAELGEDFERLTTHILDKNAELYRRLA